MRIPIFIITALALQGLTLADASAQAHQPPKVEPDTYQWQYAENPYPGDADAIRDGQRLYRSTCNICHAGSGSRGPNLRKSKLKGQAFIRIVLNGRKGTQMPAWKGKLTEDDMWKIYTFLEAPPPD